MIGVGCLTSQSSHPASSQLADERRYRRRDSDCVQRPVYYKNSDRAHSAFHSVERRRPDTTFSQSVCRARSLLQRPEGVGSGIFSVRIHRLRQVRVYRVI